MTRFIGKEPEGFLIVAPELERLGFNCHSNNASYVAIRARSNPRWWLLPVTWGRVASRSLEMFQPVTTSALFLKAGAALFAFCGGFFLFPKAGSISGSPLLTRAFGEDRLRCAIFTGTDGPDRKITIQVMRRDGKILGYIKSSSGKAAANLSHEAEMLACLAKKELEMAHIPQVIDFGCVNRATYLATNSMRSPSAKVTRVIGRHHMRFLQELAHKTVFSTEPLCSVAARLRLRLLSRDLMDLPSDVYSVINSALELIASHRGEIRKIFVHGDFTAWNSFIAEDKLYVFDFEYAQEDGLPCEDYFHFVVCQEAIDGRWPPRDLLHQLISDSKVKVLEADESTRKTLLACYLIKYLMDSSERNDTGADWRKTREVTLRMELLQQLCAIDLNHIT